ncbi:class I lanthipeptide, partial [Flavobacterium jumunjinense]
MKKIQLNKGLNLNKETVTKLQESQLSNFKGG